MSDCIFCKVINGELPSKKVYEDEDFYSFWDINPKAPIHILTVPKKHIVNLDELEDSDNDLLGKILLLNKKLAKENNTTGNYKIVTNVGKKAGQTVLHMHFHLLGGWKDESEVESELKL